MPWKQRSHKRCPIGLLLAAISATASAAATSQGVTPVKPNISHNASTECGAEIFLAVRINGVKLPFCEHIGHLTSGGLAALPQTFQRWRIPLPDTAPIRFEGEVYFPLDAVKGLVYHVDEANQELVLTAPPDVFLPTRISGQPDSPVYEPVLSSGGFFNYALSSLRSQGVTSHSGLLELSAFNRLGVGTGTFLWQGTGDDKGVTRLDTTWTRDEPDEMFRLRFGDSIGRAGTWGRSVRFGGIQMGRSFDTQPGFVPFPLPGARGEAVIPSTVDVLVNNVLRLRRDVPSGPFEVRNVPVISGQGEVRLVVTDLLGRQQVITQPYYASPTLLREDLDDYTFEAGFIRNNYGVSSGDYGRFLATATYRLGVTNRLTREFRAEILPGQQAVGVSGVYLWPALGTGNASAALSHSQAGNGGLLSMGIQHLAQRLSFTLQGQVNSRQFTQIGLLPDAGRPHQTLAASVGFSPGGNGAMSISYLHQSFWGQADTRVVSANYNLNLGQDFYLSILALESRSGDISRNFSVIISRPFGSHTSANARFTHETAGDGAALQIQRNLPTGPGYGYNLLTESGSNKRKEAKGFMQTHIGSYSAEASRSSGISSYRLGASGSVAFMGGGIFPGRRIDDSFAVVKAGGYPGVRVYAENQLVARTDRLGLAMIPHLRAYDKNSISIEPRDLPLDAQVGVLRLQLTPYLRSGVYAEFPVKPSRGGSLTIMLEDGSPIPPGAIIQIVGRAEEFPVAYHGQAFLTGLAEANDLVVSWKEQECRINVAFPPGAGPLPDLGSFLCKGIKP